MYIKLISLCILLIFIIILYPYNKKKESFESCSIPKVIIQTYYDFNKIPDKVYSNIKLFAPDYKHIIYNDYECIQFLDKHFDKKISQTFKNLKVGAHKADLFRYCYLYMYGGVYLDIKTVLIKPIDELFNKDYFYTVVDKSKKRIYQGIIACKAKNSLFLDLINQIVNSNKPVYHSFIRYMYQALSKKKNGSLKIGLNKMKDNSYLYLFQEKCSTNNNDKSLASCSDGKDRYGLCCYIYDNDNKPVIKTRYADFPW